MKKNIIVFIIAAFLVACNSTDKFKVSGVILDAADQMLYLEHIGLLKTEIVDSTKLNKEGIYHFKGVRPQYPDFYRLRLGANNIDFSVDSCETIGIDADAKSFSLDYKVTGSQNSADIQLLRKSVSDIQTKVNRITPEMGAQQRNEIIADVEVDVAKHKEMARKMILKNPRSTVAYYAIYQKINNSYMFSPYSSEDKPYCSAVATAYNAFMPDYDRTKNLYSLVVDAIQTERSNKAEKEWQKVLDEKGKGYIDIEMKDKDGITRKLSDLEGKVVLIDFSAYEMDKSVQYIFELRELYNKYHSRGFEIYQVSLDRGKLLWEESVKNIPWVCVRDEKGPDCVAVRNYNLQSIPTYFLLNKKGSIESRNADFKELETQIIKSL
ncbi:MAG: TlpA disulfide reductase family protein [Paludibacter sp.]|nr:TlpA disulfide reductase family protein [Paludibacter sp.]